MYAIVDLETTGGNSHSDQIIEVAILLHDGEQVTETFSSLVNPFRRIPYRITSITGITQQMVSDAPRFFEIAKTIVQLTEDRTLVAHNAKFDFQFLRQAFKSLAFDFKREQICTLALSRQLLPRQRSYKLGALCKAMDIPFRIGHRAQADAEATAQLFTRLLDIRQGRTQEAIHAKARFANPEANLHKDRIDQLPKEAGVYYFYNANRELIYIGKSVDIRSRVLSHFANHTTTRALEMKSQIAHIRCEVTGSELVALLKESEEIKLHKPPFNRAQRRSVFRHGVFSDRDEAGYLKIWVERIRKNGPAPVAAFSTVKGAKGFLERMLEEYELCQRHCGLHRMKGPCFYYTIHKCKGACIGEESAEDYNARAEKVLDRLQFEHENMIIIDKGRHEGEKSIVGVERGKYLGYTFIEAELMSNDPKLLKTCLEEKMDNRDVRKIISLYLRQQKAEKILHW